MMCALRDCAEQDAVARALRLRARRGDRGRRARSTDTLVRDGLHGRLRDHRRADRPAHRRPGQGRAGDPHRGPRARRARLDAVARRQRDPEGHRRLPPHRDPAVRARVLELFDRPVDQPRADRRAATRSTRSPTAARSTSTSATCPTRTPGEILAQIRAIADVDGRSRCFTRAPATSSRAQPVRPRAARRGRRARSRASAVRRARRRLRRHLVPQGRHPGVEFGPAAAATTARRSGSRSPRSARYRQALARFVARCPSGSRASAPRRERLTRDRRRPGVSDGPQPPQPPERPGAAGARRVRCSAALADRAC